MSLTASIFLSHSHKDKDFVRRLARDLAAEGVKVWVDEAEMFIGDSLIEKIGNAISTMDYVGAVISKDSTSSSWVTRELELALNHEIAGRRVKVLPLLIEDCDMPHFLIGKVYADFRDTGRYEETVALLMRRLAWERPAESRTGPEATEDKPMPAPETPGAEKPPEVAAPQQPDPYPYFSGPFRHVRDMAIDLGTAHTRIYLRGKGIVLNAPSVIAFDTANGRRRVKAVGDDAAMMLGKAPDRIEVRRPISEGVISNAEATEEMLKHFIRRIRKPSLFQSIQTMIFTVPVCSTQVDRRALRDLALRIGAKRVELVEKPMAAAVGSDCPVTEPIPSLVLDIGAGVAEVAILALRASIYTVTIRAGGDKMNEAISSHARRNYNLEIGEATAEDVKRRIGHAKRPSDGNGLRHVIRGRDILSGVLRQTSISQDEIVIALSDCVDLLVEGVRIALEKTPSAYVADVIDQGIVLTGGGALLPGLAEVLRDETGLGVCLADDAELCAAIGVGRVLEEEVFRGVATPI